MRDGNRAAFSAVMLAGFWLIAWLQVAVVLVVVLVVLSLLPGGLALRAAAPLCVATAGLLGYATVRALRLRRASPAGVPVTRADAPALWSMIDAAATAAGVTPPDGVTVIAEAVASLTERTRLAGLLGGRRELYLGLPLLQAWDAARLRAAVAHELAHDSPRLGRFAPLAYRGRVAVGRIVPRIPARNPAGPLLRAYAGWYRRRDAPFSRAQELAADQIAAAFAGPRAAVAMLRDGPALDGLQRLFHAEYLSPGWQAGYVPDDVFGGFLRVLAARADEVALLRAQHPEPPPAWDTHPPVADRLAALLQPPLPSSAAQSAQPGGADVRVAESGGVDPGVSGRGDARGRNAESGATGLGHAESDVGGAQGAGSGAGLSAGVESGVGGPWGVGSGVGGASGVESGVGGPRGVGSGVGGAQGVESGVGGASGAGSGVGGVQGVDSGAVGARDMDSGGVDLGARRPVDLVGAGGHAAGSRVAEAGPVDPRAADARVSDSGDPDPRVPGPRVGRPRPTDLGGSDLQAAGAGGATFAAGAAAAGRGTDVSGPGSNDPMSAGPGTDGPGRPDASLGAVSSGGASARLGAAAPAGAGVSPSPASSDGAGASVGAAASAGVGASPSRASSGGAGASVGAAASAGVGASPSPASSDGTGADPVGAASGGEFVAAGDMVPDLPGLGRALQAVAYPVAGRTVAGWDEFFGVARKAEMEREADAALRAISRAAGAPVAGADAVFDLAADGRLAEVAKTVFGDLPAAETAEHITGLITLLLALAALNSGVARWRHSWTGTAELVALDGSFLDLGGPAALAGDPATVGAARERLTALGIDLAATATAGGAHPAARVPVLGGVVNVLVDGARTDLLVVETGLFLVPGLPRSRNGDAKRRLARLAAGGVRVDGSAAGPPVAEADGAANSRFVPFADVAAAMTVPSRRRNWEVSLQDGGTLTIRTALDSDELPGGWTALDDAVAFLSRTR